MRRFHVIKGGKAGERKTSASGPRLSMAYSVSNLVKGESVFHDVKFNWYCLERRGPAFPPSQLIADYESRDERERRLLERELNRYFTDEEIELLRGYLLERYGMSLETEEVEIPLRERRSLFGEGSSVIYDFLELSEKDGYSLPFKVWGYYTLQNCLTSPSLENGVRLVRRALELLEIDFDFTDSRLEAVLKKIYEEKGLFVKSKD